MGKVINILSLVVTVIYTGITAYECVKRIKGMIKPEPEIQEIES